MHRHWWLLFFQSVILFFWGVRCMGQIKLMILNWEFNDRKPKLPMNPMVHYVSMGYIRQDLLLKKRKEFFFIQLELMMVGEWSALLWTPFRKTCAPIEERTTWASINCEPPALCPTILNSNAILGWNDKKCNCMVYRWCSYPYAKKERPCMEHLLKSKYPHHLFPAKLMSYISSDTPPA